MSALSYFGEPPPKILKSLHTPERRDSLSVVRCKAEANPWKSVVSWMPSAAANLVEYFVVRGCVAPEVLLNAREDRSDHLLACKDIGLETARHATVAVAERMDHHEIEVD